MSYTDKLHAEWSDYLPELTKQADFDEFWSEALSLAKERPLDLELKDESYPSPYVTVRSLTYSGIDGTTVHGWLIEPNFVREQPLPCVIHYHGFGGDRGVPSDFMDWVMMGVALISVDVRDQSGETGTCADHANGSMANVYNRGILDKDDYYVRYVYTDAIRAIDVACSLPNIDSSRLIIEGGSQGGALTIAMAALDDRPILALADVPSNSNIEARIMGENGAYSCVTQYLKKYPERMDQCFNTLSYFDTMNMADRIKCRVVASVGGRDPICPAQMFYATYNRINAPKEVHIYPFNGHEGGHRIQKQIKLQRLKEYVLD